MGLVGGYQPRLSCFLLPMCRLPKKFLMSFMIDERAEMLSLSPLTGTAAVEEAKAREKTIDEIFMITASGS